MEQPQTENKDAGGQSSLTVRLERMFRVVKTDHPDLVGGIVWADCELAWINDRITLAILAEREACAVLCDEQAMEPECPERARYCADAIRMRPTSEFTGGTLLCRPRGTMG